MFLLHMHAGEGGGHKVHVLPKGRSKMKEWKPLGSARTVIEVHMRVNLMANRS